MSDHPLKWQPVQPGGETVQLADILDLGGRAVVYLGKHRTRLLKLAALGAVLTMVSLGAMVWPDALMELSGWPGDLDEIANLVTAMAFVAGSALFMGALMTMLRGGYETRALVTIDRGGIEITDKHRQTTYAHFPRGDIAEIQLIRGSHPDDSVVTVRTVYGEKIRVDFSRSYPGWRGFDGWD